MRGGRRFYGAQVRDIPYASVHANQKIDILYPFNGTPPFPAVFYIHGGGWQNGNRLVFPGEPYHDIRNYGIAVISTGYRLTSAGYRWPLQIHDVKAGLRLARTLAPRYHIDPDRIASWGSSAGATLAAIVALTPGVPQLTDQSMGNPGVSEAVHACISWFGPTMFREEDADFVAQLNETGFGNQRGWNICSTSSQEFALLNANPCTAPAQLHNDSSVVYWCANGTALPRFRIEHGIRSGGVGGDGTIPINQARRFRTALEARGLTFNTGTNYYEEVLGGSHGYGSAAWSSPTHMNGFWSWCMANI